MVKNNIFKDMDPETVKFIQKLVLNRSPEIIETEEESDQVSHIEWNLSDYFSESDS